MEADWIVVAVHNFSFNRRGKLDRLGSTAIVDSRLVPAAFLSILFAAVRISEVRFKYF